MSRAPTIHIGLAGWSNPPSDKARRPSGQSHLEYYAAHFDCVEINSSFYRPHRPSTYAAWALATPGTFRFSVKMPRTITHDSGLRGTSRDMTQFFSGIEALGRRLRVILIQLPPSLEFEPRVAKAFFKSIPRQAGVTLVCEPRHASWYTGAAEGRLAEWSVARVAADPVRTVGAGSPSGHPDLAYYRWHGSPQLYYSSYSDTHLDAFAEEVRRHGRIPTWCIFDNTARHAAWDNALAFVNRLAAKKPP
jgi:uncharacterized protein YecE (DUF72 family)